MGPRRENVPEFTGDWCDAWGEWAWSRRVAACGGKTPPAGGGSRRCVDVAGGGLGPGGGDAAGGHRHSATADAGPGPARSRPCRDDYSGAGASRHADAAPRPLRVASRRHHARDRHRLRPQQGAGDGADGHLRGLLAGLFAQRGGDAAAAHSRRHHEQRPGQRIRHRPALSRFQRLPGAGHAAGARRLHAGRAHQRGLWRHRQLGPDPDHRHRPCRRLDQQSGLRPQCAGRRDQLPDEGRLHL